MNITNNPHVALLVSTDGMSMRTAQTTHYTLESGPHESEQAAVDYHRSIGDPRIDSGELIFVSVDRARDEFGVGID